MDRAILVTNDVIRGEPSQRSFGRSMLGSSPLSRDHDRNFLLLIILKLGVLVFVGDAKHKA